MVINVSIESDRVSESKFIAKLARVVNAKHDFSTSEHPLPWPVANSALEVWQAAEKA